MNKKISIIGAGVMGGVILNGIIQSKLYKPENILVTANRDKKLSLLKEKYRVNISTNNKLAIDFSDYIIIAVKPVDVIEVLKELKEENLSENSVIVSIAAGVMIKRMQDILDKNPIIRVMTNTPCLVNKGVSVISGNNFVKTDNFSETNKIFSSVGETINLPEKYFDAVTGLSGSGPAFFFVIVETLIDAGVLQGLPRDVSRKLVIETMIGSALLIKETGEHPAPLKDMVSSPGGTTVSGLQILEEYKVRAALLKIVETATKKAEELGN